MKMQKVSFGDLNVCLTPKSTTEKTMYQNVISELGLIKEDEIKNQKHYTISHNDNYDGFILQAYPKTEEKIFDKLSEIGIVVKKIAQDVKDKMIECYECNLPEIGEEDLNIIGSSADIDDEICLRVLQEQLAEVE